ncbi:Putative ribonuclease H protein [Dendrobium catenatum]|uniref:Ribonuclease H protein n=1 Tax=Dendrobium catenatum TaxID=906689 RepID=A0A2I0XAU1_9ASPA|nr:Putative ribonuclease H protein [Dendrobium catenatum]
MFLGAPPKEWTKINIDASLTTSGVAGIGGVFRDYNGRFVLAFGEKMMHWDITQLEMGAILSVKDYVKSWMRDYKGVIVESDNINVIKYIQNSLKQNKGIMKFNLVRDSLFVNDFNKVVFLHAYRKCNKVANLCATMALENSFYFDSFSFDDIPPLMASLIKEEYHPFDVCN